MKDNYAYGSCFPTTSIACTPIWDPWDHAADLCGAKQGLCLTTLAADDRIAWAALQIVCGLSSFKRAGV